MRAGTSHSTPVIQAFLNEVADVADVPSRACFGIACPVVNGKCTMTNHSWAVDASSLAAEIGSPRPELINDFHAVGHAIQRLTPTDLVTLQRGESTDHGVVALIGAGTGLGEAFMTWTGEAYRVHSSEGGHASFSARNDVEFGLLAALRNEFGHVSTERVVSGPGLVHIYRHLFSVGDAEEQDSVRAEMARSDPAALIAERALAGTDPISERALDIFASAYGAQASDLALTVLATGGVYVAGGIAPRILPKLRDGAFMRAFLDKGRLVDVLARVPVRVIVNPDVGLIGAAAAAMQRWPGG